MATIAYVILLFLTISTISTIHARESQFFAKVSNNNPQETQPLNTNQQTPDFVPQSREENGGSFGHESGQLPPSATAATATGLPANLPENYNPVAYTTPIHSSTQEDQFNQPQEYRYNGESQTYNSQNQNQNENQNQNQNENQNQNQNENQNQFIGTNDGGMYIPEKQGMSDTRFLDNGKYYYTGDNAYNSPKQGFEDASFMETQDSGKMYNSQKQGENEMYNSQSQGMGEAKYSTTNNADMYNSQKQGMSDTRFLENGKYYYDLNMENLNANTNLNSNSRDGYNTQGYYGNNENSYDRYNSNGGYQNQEFQGDQFNP
ncbi:hypothetical protein SSX86_015641 [Deinandra increscens subsp. villosa]|uniref:Protein E6-like n=1 Tax=Deinandra increscens subsp. villosa TaxID=3103831 RepID=A0AAP0GWD9_9ASTR